MYFKIQDFLIWRGNKVFILFVKPTGSEIAPHNQTHELNCSKNIEIHNKLNKDYSTN